MSNPSIPAFSQEQITYIQTRLFDTLDEHFNWPLGDKKRKAAMAKAFKANNYDALLQRCLKNESKPGSHELNTILTVHLHQILRYDAEMLYEIEEAQFGDIIPGDQEPLEDESSEPRRYCAGFDRSFIIRFNGETGSQLSDKAARNVINNLTYIGPISPAFEKILFDAIKQGCIAVEISLDGDYHEDYPVFHENFSENNHHLKGMQCPRCGQQDRLLITTSGVATSHLDPTISDSGIQAAIERNDVQVTEFMALYDDQGTADVVGHSEYSNHAFAECPDCGYEKRLSVFKSQQKEGDNFAW